MSRLWTTAAAIALFPALAFAQAPTPTPNPALQKAQAVFEALPEAERRQIQLDLSFAADFMGAAQGGFGPLTFRALQLFEQKNKSTADGVLDPAERAALAASARRERERLGFRQVTDAVTKASLGLPMALLSKSEPQPGGTRWQSADGKVTVITRAPPSTEGTLDQMFEKAQASPNPQRKVTYKLLRPDFFVVAGETPQGKFHQRMTKLPDGSLKGFSISYDKTLAPVWDRLTVATANTFFPAGAPASVVAATATPPVVQPPPDPFAPRTFARALTATVVAPNRIVTASAALRACPQASVGGRPLRVLAEEGGLALADVAGLAAPPLTARLATAEKGPVAVLTQGFQASGGRSLQALPGEIDRDFLAAALQPGAAGAPVFGPDGGLAGLVVSDPSARLQVAGVVLAARHRVAGADVLEKLLKAGGVAFAPAIPASAASPASGGSLGAISTRHGRAVLAIACVG